MAIIKKSTHKSGEGVEKRKPPYTVGVNINWYSQWWKAVWRFLKKLETEFPHDSASPLLGLHPDRILTRKDTCTPVSQQPRHGSDLNVHQQRSGWREVLHVLDGIPLSHKEKERMLSAATRMDLELIRQSDASHSETDTVIWYHLWNLKYDTYFQNK